MTPAGRLAEADEGTRYGLVPGFIHNYEDRCMTWFHPNRRGAPYVDVRPDGASLGLPGRLGDFYIKCESNDQAVAVANALVSVALAFAPVTS